MKQISVSSRFRKDYKKSQRQNRNLKILREVIEKLANDEPLDKKYKNHPLAGEWKGYSELHLQSDWLLIYKITQTELRLARIGSHSELFR